MARRSKQALRPAQWLFLLAVIALVAILYVQTGEDPLDLFPTSTPALETAVAGSDGAWSVHFTNPNALGDPSQLEGSVAAVLIDYIAAAHTRIHIASFEFDLEPVADALIAAHQRGVEVRWMTDDQHGLRADEEKERLLFSRMTEAGIEVKDDGRSGLMHHKFWIFDDRVLWTGSTNITVNGIFRNNNNAIVFDSPAVAAIYAREFTEMWEQGLFGITSPSTVEQQVVVLQDPAGDPARDTRIQVLFAPEDGVSARLAAAVAGAQESIHFMAFSFTDEAIGAAMLERAGSGVVVTGIFETRGSQTQYSRLSSLFCAGLAVRQDGNPRTFHHKVIVLDGDTVITGSYNFSGSADSSNEENVLMVANPEIAAAYLQEFERRWAEARDVDPANMNCP